MKWRSLSILCCLAISALFSGCSGGDRTNTTPVSVTVGSAQTARKALSRSALLSKATPTVASITFTITGPGMDTIVRVVPITPPQTITEVFSVPSGLSRNFKVEAKDGSDVVLYSGSMLANLNGMPLNLTLPLQAMIFNQLIHTPFDDEATSIARAQDGNGNIVIAGFTYGDMGGMNADPTHATPDVFVTKLTPTGGAVWARQFGSNGYDICYSAATDSAGNIYIAGSTAGNPDTASQGGSDKAGVVDAFVTKLSPAGLVLWTRLTGTAGYYTWGNAVAVDDVGSVYLSGSTEGCLVSIQTGTAFANQDPDNAPNRQDNTYDVFMVKYDTDGLPQWNSQFGTPFNDTGESIAFSSAASGPPAVFVVGSTGGDLGATNSNPGVDDLYVAKFDTTGVPLWTKQLGSNDLDDAWGIAIDQTTGDIYVTGDTYGDLDGNANMDTTGMPGTTADIFLVKYDINGGHDVLNGQWTRQLGTTSNESANGITFDNNGAGVVITGHTSGDLDGLGNAGLNDMAMARYSTSGALLDKQQLGTKADDFGASVVTDQNGTITVLGNTFGGFTSSATEDIFLQRYGYSLP